MPFDPYYGNTTDDELLTLARSAGVLPEEEIGMEEPEVTRQDYHNWVPQQLGYQSNYEAPTTPEVPQAPTPEGSTSTSVGVSQSHRGFNPAKWGETAVGDQELNYDLAASETEAQGRENRMVEPTVLARNQSIEAEQAKANAEIQAIHGKGEQALVMQRLQDEFAVEEARANAEAQSLANKSKADYMAALADFRASRVDPAQLWGHMTGGERFGTLVTAFVHDFLGARGINTSAMATLNKAIDRNIDAQVMAIKTKGEVAEGFKSLWWMQRNQAASDTEARARVRGFLLEGAKQAVIANMTKYEAGLASAQGQQALAKIDEELAKNLIEIYKHSDANALSLRNQAIEKWKTKLQMSMESWANAIRAKEAETNRLRQQNEEKPESIDILFDPETNEPRWYFDPRMGIEKEEKIKAREQLEAVKQVSTDLNELRQLTRRSAPVFDGIGGTRFANTDQQRFDALATRIAHGMAKANGERATDKDVEQFLKGFRQHSWFNQAEAEKVIAATQAQVLRAPQAKLAVIARDIPKEAQQQFGLSAREKPLEGDLIDATNTADPPPLTQGEKDLHKALESVSGPQARKPYTGSNSEVEKAHKKALESYGDVFTPDESVPITGPGGQQVAEGKKKRPIYQFEKTMVELRRIARNGGPEGKKAIEHLTNLAQPYLNNLPMKDDESAFAALMLSTLDE